MSRVRLRALAAVLAAALAAGGFARAATAPRDLSVLDLVMLEVAYDTLTSQYYQRVAPQRLVDGARAGIVAYLRGRGLADPAVPFAHAANYAQGLHALNRAVGQTLLRYGARVQTRELIYAAIAGELAAVHDPYTVFFTPKEYRAFTTFLNPSSFGGVGLVLTFEGTPRVAHVQDAIPGGPADKAGIRAGDELLAVDGRLLAGITPDATGTLLRGKIGTSVQLTVRRNGETLAPLAVVRSAVRPPDVFARLIGDDVGYVQLTSYGADAGTQLEAALARLQKQGARAWILDLRDDGGGYRDVALRVTSDFIPGGPLLTVEERSGKRTTLRSQGARFVPRPLVVLVNGNTASAAEITAGAVHDTGAGTLVGEKTYGKGLVQQVVPLPDGSAFKLTVERYYTAGGHDLDRRGIAPDVEVAQPAGAVSGDPGSDAQLARALAIVRAPVVPATP